MSQRQIYILNVVGGLCSALILATLILIPVNNRLDSQVMQTQNQLQSQYSQEQQMHKTLEDLAVRIAQSAQTEPVLLDLLRRYDLKVGLNVDGQVKQVP